MGSLLNSYANIMIVRYPQDIHETAARPRPHTYTNLFLCFSTLASM